ncbi:MAG: hypothetical protein FJZ79_06745 [Chlorobi bacterium]|nr:hypothetical protein [Chlorobiota bacterium]
MKTGSRLPAVLGLMLSALFIATALSVYLFAYAPSPEARRDLLLYALLTGAYGIWRLIRVLTALKKPEENV